MYRILFNYHIAIDAIKSNVLKSGLTALGIIFGVSSVITMLAIGRGAKQEILDQMKLVGVNNIIIHSAENDLNSSQDEKRSDKENNSTSKFSPGLNVSDFYALKNVLGIDHISIEQSKSVDVNFAKNLFNTSLIGVNENYFKIFNFQFEHGNGFTSFHENNRKMVCVIGAKAKTKLFKTENAIGRNIKINSNWFLVIGVLGNGYSQINKLEDLGITDVDNKIFIPVDTYLLLFNRVQATKPPINNNQNSPQVGILSLYDNQTCKIDKLVLQVNRPELLSPVADIIGRMLFRRHNSTKDYEIIIPRELLKQQEKTKRIFNLVLGLIAGISLLVGGIGIMNIMYASVYERTKEIGIRLAIGAKKTDIILQFLIEAILIALIGGVIGIILGIFLSFLIQFAFGIQTIISIGSIILSFSVAFIIGIVFGYYPAFKASQKSPIESIRYE